MFDSLKKAFARSNIKDTTTPQTPQETALPPDAINFLGRSSSCESARSYFEGFVAPPGKSSIKQLFVGELNKICPGCNVIVNGRNYGQIHSIGLNFGSTLVTLKTELDTLSIEKRS